MGILSEKQIALLVLRVIIDNNGVDGMISRNYATQKIDEIMDARHPERLLDDKRRVQFHKLAEEVRQNGVLSRG